MSKEIIITLIKRIKAAIITAAFVFLCVPVFGQMTLSIDDISSCDSISLHLSVNVLDFTDVNAITLYIEYDTTQVVFEGLVNPHPDLLISGGSLIGNANISNITSVIVVTWFRMSSLSIDDGKLFDLVLFYKQGSAELTFSENCEIAQGINPVEEIVLNHGSIKPLINQQPQDSSLAEGENASFSVNPSQGSTYQWQINSASDWINLSETLPYSGIDNHVLTIENISQELSNNQYRCLVHNENCQAISEYATLIVSPLNIQEHEIRPTQLKIFPIPSDGKLHFQVSSTISDVRIAIINLLGKQVYYKKIDKLQANIVETIITDHLHSGLYFFQLSKGNLIINTAKIVIK